MGGIQLCTAERNCRAECRAADLSYGIAIFMYFNEGIHAVPHFHARYAGAAASVDLDGKCDRGLVSAARAIVGCRLGGTP